MRATNDYKCDVCFNGVTSSTRRHTPLKNGTTTSPTRDACSVPANVLTYPSPTIHTHNNTTTISMNYPIAHNNHTTPETTTHHKTNQPTNAATIFMYHFDPSIHFMPAPNSFSSSSELSVPVTTKEANGVSLPNANVTECFE